jgi:hypothetical protein
MSLDLRRDRHCPTPDLVYAAGEGVLPAALDARIVAHVQQCAACRALIAALDDATVGELTSDERERIRRRVDSARREETAPPVVRWRWAAAAALITVGGTVGGLVVWQRSAERAVVLPAAPSLPQSPAFLPPVTGTVTGPAGEPLPGVTVALYEHGPGTDALSVISRSLLSDTSDPLGRYQLAGVGTRPPIILRAAKPGYFSIGNASPPGPERRVDFRLRPWTTTPIGPPIADILQPTELACGMPEPCRQFAISLPVGSTLDVSVNTPVRAALDLWVEAPSGDVYYPPETAPLRVVVPAPPGIYQITVIGSPGAPHPFQLTMRVR